MAGKTKGVTIAIKADTSGATAGLSQLTDESIKLSKQLKSVDALMKMDGGNPEVAAQRQEILTKSIANTEERLKALRNVQEDVKRKFESGEINREQYIAFQRELVTTEQRLRDLTAAEQETETESAQASESAGKFGETLKNIVAKGAELAYESLKMAAEAVVSFAKDSVSAGMDFDKAVSQIGATMGYTTEQLADSTSEAAQNLQTLREKAQEMGAKTSFSATQAADALNVLAMSGYDAETSCAMVADVLNLAQAGSLDLAAAAKYTSGAMKGFADDTKTAQYYTDLMALGATKANTNVDQLGAALSKGAATAGAYKQSAEGTTLALLRLAEQGAVGEEAATTLNRAMADLYTATPAGKKALEELGVSAYDIAGNYRDFNTVIDELNAALKGYDDEAQANYKNTIFTTNGLNAFNKMTVTSTEKVQEWTAALRDADGAAASQAETMRDNLAGDVDVFNSTMEAAKLAVSDKLTPAIRGYVQFATESVSALTEAFKAGGIENMTDVLTDIFTKLIQRVSVVVPIIAEIAKSLLEAFTTAVTRNLSELIRSAMKMVVKLAKGIVDAAPKIIPAAVELVGELVETLTRPDLLSMLVGAAIELTVALTDGLIQALPELLEYLPQIVQNIVDVIVENAPKLLEAAEKIVTALAEYLFDSQNVDTMLTAAMDIITTLVKGLMSVIWKIGEAAGKIVEKIAEKIGLGDYWKMGADIIDQFMGGIIDAWNRWQSWWEGFGEYIYDALHPSGDTQTDWENYIGNAAGGTVGNARALIGADALAGNGSGGISSTTANNTTTISFGNVIVNGGDKNAANDFIRQVDRQLRDLQTRQNRGIGGVSWATS